MDIEFYPALNQGLNGEISMKILRLIISNEIYILAIQRFPRLLQRVRCFDDLSDKSMTLETDSSARYKFSRHIVCRLPYGLVFSNTGHCGTFVQRICSSFQKCLLNFSDQISHLHTEKPSALPSWVEHVRRRKKTDIIDFSIYTPNRDFRIVQSAMFEDLC